MKLLMETEGRIEGLKDETKILAEFLSMASAPVAFKCFENHLFRKDKPDEQITLDRNKEYYIITGKKGTLHRLLAQSLQGIECMVM